MLLELSRFASVAALLSAGADRLVETVLPELVRLDGCWQIRYPGADTPGR